jgi:RNA polymerase sigma factor (sigma-70 family)
VTPKKAQLAQAAAALGVQPAASMRSLVEGDPRFVEALTRIAREIARHELARRHFRRQEFEDAIQEVLLRVLRAAKVARFVDASRLLAWVWRVANSSIIDRTRYARRVHEAEASWSATEGHRLSMPSGEDGVLVADRLLAGGDEPLGAAMKQERSEIVGRAIAQLTQRQRDALLRWLLEGETLAAIGKRQGTSRRTTARAVVEAKEILVRFIKRFDM